MRCIVLTAILLANNNVFVLPHKVLPWGADSNIIFILSKKAVRAIIFSGSNAHMESF